MATARETVRLGLAARGAAQMKVRQPLTEAVVVAAGPEREAIERLAEIVRDELNVKRVRVVAGDDELSRYEIKPNYRTLGPRFGAAMPMAAVAIAALDPSHAAAAVRDGRLVVVTVDGRDHQLTAEDLLLTMQPLEGYSVEREGGHAVALELTLDEPLRREGQAREIVHAVQIARRNAGLAVEDRIALWLGGDETLVSVAREHEPYIVAETLAVEAAYEPARPPHDAHAETVTIDGLQLRIALARRPRR